MFAYTALPFSLAPQLSFALFFLSILFATAAGVTAFLLLASGNLQNLQEKFDYRKRSRTLPIVAENGEILATKDEILFHLDILETKLKNKAAELEAWKGKLNIAEMEMQKLNNASGEVRRHYMKLKTDVVKTDEDCKEIQKQIEEFRRRQAEVCPELLDKRGHSCSKGISKARNDTPPEAYGRVATVMKSLKSLSSIKHFKNLTGAMSHLLITTLSSIGIILPHEAPYGTRRRNFGNDPNTYLQQNKTGRWSRAPLDSSEQRDKKYIKVVNFPFPPKSPPPNLFSNIILWAIKQLRFKKQTKDRAVNHCTESSSFRLSTTGRDRIYSAERVLTEKIADKLKTLIIFQFMEDDKINRGLTKNTVKSNEKYRKLAKLLKVNDTLLSRLLSETKNKYGNSGMPCHSKRHYHDSSKTEIETITSAENPSIKNNEKLSHLERNKTIQIPEIEKAESALSKSKFIYVRSRTDTEESSKDTRKTFETEGSVVQVPNVKTASSTTQLQKKRIELIHMTDAEVSKEGCMERNKSETPFYDLCTTECHSKQQLHTFDSKISSIDSESQEEKKVGHINKGDPLCSSTKAETISRLTRDQICIVSITPTPIQIVFDAHQTKSEGVSCTLIKLHSNEDIQENVTEKDQMRSMETVKQPTCSVPNSSLTVCINEEKNPTSTSRSPLTIQKKSRTLDDMKVAKTYSNLVNKVSYSSHYAKTSKEQLRGSSNKAGSPGNSVAEELKEKISRNLSRRRQSSGTKSLPSSQRETLPDTKTPSSPCNTSKIPQYKNVLANKSFTRSKQTPMEDAAARKLNLPAVPVPKSTSECTSPKHWQTSKE